MVESGTPALNRSRETRAATQSGYLMLFVWLGTEHWAGWANRNLLLLSPLCLGLLPAASKALIERAAPDLALPSSRASPKPWG